MKCKEELNALKTEVKAMNENPPALTDEDLGQVTGGFDNGANGIDALKDGYSSSICDKDKDTSYDKMQTESPAIKIKTPDGYDVVANGVWILPKDNF